MRKKLLAVAALGGALLVSVVLITSLRPDGGALANPATGLSGVAAGGGHTCALTGAGGVRCWGRVTISSTVSVPVDMPSAGEPVVQLSMGTYHGCGVTSSGAAKCSGWNGNGQLGDGTTTYSELPVAVAGLSSGVSAIEAGGSHTCALTTAGGVKCWGANFYGQLGNGTTSGAPDYGITTPVDVTGLSSGVIALAAGEYHTCALTSAGAVKCWGRNHGGQLGNGTNIDSSVPVDVTGLSSGVAAIAAGGNPDQGTNSHSCALMASGDVKCWGGNSGGQLGDSTYVDRNVPVNVIALISDAVAISAGNEHTCALLEFGQIKCWGRNGNGQLGNSLFSTISIPFPVAGLASPATAISAGAQHTCAGLDSGYVQCWGLGSAGQLGNGAFLSSSAPVTVVESFSKVPPTPTPCEPNCPTPTDTATPTFTPTPTATPTPAAPGLDFSLGIDPLGGDNDACASSFGPLQTCQVRAGRPFIVHVYLNGLPYVLPNGDYAGFIATLLYSGATSGVVADASDWPDCFSSGTGFTPGKVSIGCGIGSGAQASSYLGAMATVELTCLASGPITMTHGLVDTALIEQGLDRFYEGTGIGESLFVDCVPPQALPGDTDGDGCADLIENGADEMLGGRRDYLNPYDFYDIDGNKQIDLFIDIFGVAGAFGLTPSDGGYDPALDRSPPPPGAETWAMGPPDGLVDLFNDIFGVAFQFGHDCS